MDESTKRALEAIDRVCELPRAYGAMEPTEELLRLIAKAQEFARNAAGAEKGFIEAMYASEQDLLRRAHPFLP